MTKALNRHLSRGSLVVGTMSGTSTDGYDVAVASISGSGETAAIELLAFESFELPPELKREIFAIYPPKRISAGHLAKLSFKLGELHSEWILSVLGTHGLSPRDISCIGYHGIAAFHGNPDRKRGVGGYHLEIGEAAVVAERTGCTVVCDFRTRDIAAGGEGAPLSPFSDWLLFKDATKGRAIQNIGGIGNVTGLRPAAARDEVIAFDTGPGNMIIDSLMQIATQGKEAFDENGRTAARGVVDQVLLGELMEFPYFRMSPPKSTGRELFGEAFTRRFMARAENFGLTFEDTVATATSLTAHSIADQYRRFLSPRFRIDEVVVGGGGCHNDTLMASLRRLLDPVPVRVHEDFGINGDAREALYWAIMANETVHGRPSNMPSVTGAREYVVLGKVLAGRNR